MRPALFLLLTCLILGQADAASKSKAAPVSKPAPPAARTAAELASAIRPSLVKITQIGREGTDGIGSG
ncbi:hypothetical protein OFN94_41210, partial [Escherichia coli]|nr:hypothetical protein [Escherichia coli]